MSALKGKIKKLLLQYLPGIFKVYAFRLQAKLTWKTLDYLNFEVEILILEAFFKANRNAVFIDIGANKGEYIYAADKFLSKKNIHAFEPNADLFFMIKAIFRKSNINNYAISNKNGDARLKIPLVNHILNDALGRIDTEPMTDDEKETVVYPIKTIKLETYYRNLNLNEITCIKIDAEGHELMVLEGAKEILKTFMPVIIIEIEKRSYSDYHSVISIIRHIKEKFLTDVIYNVYYYNISNKKIQLLEEEPIQELNDWGTRKYINNFIFIPNGHAFYSTLEEINSGIY